jgi:hypothetical protein
MSVRTSIGSFVLCVVVVDVSLFSFEEEELLLRLQVSMITSIGNSALCVLVVDVSFFIFVELLLLLRSQMSDFTSSVALSDREIVCFLDGNLSALLKPCCLP